MPAYERLIIKSADIPGSIFIQAIVTRQRVLVARANASASLATFQLRLLYESRLSPTPHHHQLATHMEEIKIAVAVAAFCLSLASFIIAHRASQKAKRAETITHLLGSKESVGFAALKLLRDGLPKSKDDRKLMVASLVQACIFSGSDRARALLYRVVELNRESYREEFRTAAEAVSQTFQSMQTYDFDSEDLDLERGRRRLTGLLKVIEGHQI